ncbi:hypothetical protein CDL60_17445 [Roseateles noduli]|nr:hypothetical protein CDL60_17445 [Roseateles noduli]
MGLDAQLIAIGPFSQDIASALEYGPTAYADVTPGATVVTNVLVACTSSASHLLAKAFGVGAMELGKHHLRPETADLALLRQEFGDNDVDKFQRLAAHGFQFYYLPNA